MDEQRAVEQRMTMAPKAAASAAVKPPPSGV